MSEPNPTVSIIVPNYNHGSYISDAITSVLDQTYQDYEVIVVDDGSTDNSREIIGRFGDKVRTIYQPNQGLSAARNTGLRAARGAYVGLLDADDLLEPVYLETLVPSLQERPDAAGIYCGYQFVDSTNNLLPQIEARPIPQDQLYASLLDGNFLVPESILLRKCVYDSVGPFDEGLQACEDWDMWLRVTRRYGVLHTSEILTRHRVLPGSMSTDPFRMLTNRLRVLRKHVGEEPNESGCSQSHRAYARTYLSSCVEYLQQIKHECACDLLQKMARMSPTLLTEMDTYYQLGCGSQPKGFMGDLRSIQVKRSGPQLIQMLTWLFSNSWDQTNANNLETMAFAQAFYVLGILGYGSGEYQTAQTFLAQAVRRNPGLLFSGQFIAVWLKTMTSPEIMSALKGFRRLLQSVSKNNNKTE